MQPLRIETHLHLRLPTPTSPDNKYGMQSRLGTYEGLALQGLGFFFSSFFKGKVHLAKFVKIGYLPSDR